METKKKVAAVISTIIIIIFILVVAFLVLYFGMKEVDSGCYGLKYKNGEDVLLDSNKTYSPGYNWVGFNRKLHQFHDKPYEHEIRLSGVAGDNSYIGYLITGTATLRKDELYLTWYSLLGTPKAAAVNPLIQESFQEFVKGLNEEYFEKTGAETVQKDCKDFVVEAYGDTAHMDFEVKSCKWEVLSS